jgi:hypothetical protein
VGERKPFSTKAHLRADVVARRVADFFARRRWNAGDIETAYRVEIDGYRTTVTVDEGRDRFVVAAKVVAEANPAFVFASFQRTIYRTERPLRVTHDHLEVHADQRYRGFARGLLRSELAFYERAGIRHVDLDAGDDGLLIWPRYDWRPFDRSASPPERGRAIVEKRIEDVIRRYAGSALDGARLPELGPDLLALKLFSFSNDGGTRDFVLKPDTRERGVAVGLIALRELRQEGVLVPMRLDLEDPMTLSILRAKGILAGGAS